MKIRVEEEATSIPGFPPYDITNYGRVINLRTGREMILSPTQHGDLTVGLTRDERQYRYSVKGLVARAFCNFQYFESMEVVSKAFVQNQTDLFNTPILLDGDKHNLYFENIVWRPRWFAWRYTNQFTEFQPWYTFGPIREMGTDVVYESYLEAAITNGILCSDIRQSIYDYAAKSVFPTRQQFAYVDKYTNL